MERALVTALLVAVLAGAAGSQDATSPPAAKGLPFSPVRRAGATLYIGGQLPRTPEGVDVRGTVDAQTRQVMDNVGRLLQQNGYTFDDVVSCTVYLTSLQDYKEMNEAYAAYFPGAFPTRVCVGGVEIAFGFRVEVSCVAYKE